MNLHQPTSTNILRRAAVVLSALFGLSLLAAGSVHASGGFFGGTWLVNLSFPNDQPQVELTTEIWHIPASGDPYILTSQTETLDCTVSGSLQINNEVATFSGQEYIACTQPNMVDKFDEVSQGALSNVADDVVARNPFAAGQLMVAGNSASGTRPVFYHPSMQYGLNRVSTTHANQIFRVDGAATTSSSFVQAAPYDLRAELQIRPNGSYRTEFTANGVSGPGTPASLGSGLFINLEETTIYFGYSPVNNSYFQGNIHTLTIDPGAFGRD